MSHRIAPLCLFLLLIASSVCAAAEERIVTMESGERLIGEIADTSTEATLILQSPLLGELRLPRARIARIETAESRIEASGGKSVADTPPPVTPSQADPAPEREPAAPVERSVFDSLREVKAPDAWSGNLRLGINLSQGDSRWTETYFRGKLEIDPEASPSFYRFGGSYTYRETKRDNGDSFVSTDRYDGTFIYRRTFLADWFVQNSLGGRVDNRKGIEREVQELVGVGYRYEPSKTLELIVGSGGGVEDYQAESEDTRNGVNPVMNVFQEFSWDPLERASLVQKFNYYWNPNDSEQYNYVLSAAIRYRITDLLGFEFSYNEDFDNDIGNGDAKEDTRWRNAVIVYF